MFVCKNVYMYVSIYLYIDYYSKLRLYFIIFVIVKCNKT